MNAECEVDEREYAEKADAQVTGFDGELVVCLVVAGLILGSLFTNVYYVGRANSVRAAITYNGRYVVERYNAPGWDVIEECASKQEAITAAKAREIKHWHPPQPIK